VASLEKQLSQVARKTVTKGASPQAEEAPVRMRFSAKGLAKLRERLGLTAADMGALLKVSAQTVYNWEAAKAKPRQQQLTAIGALRSLGKRQVKAELAKLKG
jgi:DNA-binding transcriptional regulator YiaG